MRDPRVAGALQRWGGRFLGNGVDPGDLARIGDACAGWGDWCRTWSAAAAVHRRLGDRALDGGHTRSAGLHLAQAAVTYHFAKFLFVHDPEQLDRAHRLAVACLERALPHLDPPGERLAVRYGGGRLWAVLRRPRGRGPHPVVGLIAGLDSTKEEFRPTEQLFLERGVATLAVDGPGQGEAERRWPIRPDWEVPGAAILHHLESVPGLDPGRVDLWGVSLGGYYATRVAAHDPRVRACITLGGPYDFGEPWAALPDLTREAFRVRSRSASDAVAERRAATFTVRGLAPRVRCPVLIVAGGEDPIVPFAQADRLAAEVGGEVDRLSFATGNHGCTDHLPHHRPRSADWMADRLSG